MKKLLLGFIIILMSGCTAGEEVTCNNNGKTEVYTLKDGMVESLTIDGEKQNQNVVDELNGIYLTSATNNEEAKELLNDYMNSLGGTCQ